MIPSPQVIADYTSLFCLDEIILADAESFTLNSFKSEYLTPYPSVFIAHHDPLRQRSWDLSKVPSSYHEAMARPDSVKWHAAMKEEIESMLENKVFERSSLPADTHCIPSRRHQSDLQMQADANLSSSHSVQRSCSHFSLFAVSSIVRSNCSMTLLSTGIGLSHRVKLCCS